MNFSINLESRIPIYVQLKESIKLAIATGKLPPGSQLPTVRQLAIQLRINANTVSRVYMELEGEGILATKQGKGTFVRDRPEINNTFKEDSLNDMLDDLIIKASSLGFYTTELLRALEKKLKG
jgi:GntR family transcriptional regulator